MIKIFPAFLVVLILFYGQGVFAQTVPSQNYALMDSGDGVETYNQFLSLSQVDGIAVRFVWNKLEPADGQYDWSAVDAALTAARARNKKVTLHIAGASFGAAPSWLFAKGAKDYLLLSPKGFGERLKSTEPVPWDTTFLMEWSDFLQALSAHITQQEYWSQLGYISSGAPVPGMSLVACRDGVLPGALYNRTSYMASWKNALKSLGRYFPQTQKLVFVPAEQYICAPDSDGAAFYKELMKGFSTGNFMMFATDLNGKGSQRLDNLGDFADTLPVGLQYAGAFTNPVQGHEIEGTLQKTTCIGLQKYKARYIEMYKQDLLSTDLATQSATMIPGSPALCLQ